MSPQTATSHTQLRLNVSPLAFVAAASKERVLLPDRAASLAFSPDMAQVLADTGCQAWASLPLRGSGRILGSLTVGWASRHTFPAREVEILDAFAAHCAHGIERINARQIERGAAAAQRGWPRRCR